MPQTIHNPKGLKRIFYSSKAYSIQKCRQVITINKRIATWNDIASLANPKTYGIAAFRRFWKYCKHSDNIVAEKHLGMNVFRNIWRINLFQKKKSFTFLYRSNSMFFKEKILSTFHTSLRVFFHLIIYESTFFSLFHMVCNFSKILWQKQDYVGIYLNKDTHAHVDIYIYNICKYI